MLLQIWVFLSFRSSNQGNSNKESTWSSRWVHTRAELLFEFKTIARYFRALLALPLRCYHEGPERRQVSPGWDPSTCAKEPEISWWPWGLSPEGAMNLSKSSRALSLSSTRKPSCELRDYAGHAPLVPQVCTPVAFMPLRGARKTSKCVGSTWARMGVYVAGLVVLIPRVSFTFRVTGLWMLEVRSVFVFSRQIFLSLFQLHYFIVLRFYTLS